MRQMLLQNAAAILLQNATDVYCKIRQIFYYKMRQFYYKMQQLLQIVRNLLQNATVITKCDVYYKLRWYNFEHVIAGWGVISSEKFIHTTQWRQSLEIIATFENTIKIVSHFWKSIKIPSHKSRIAKKQRTLSWLPFSLRSWRVSESSSTF